MFLIIQKVIDKTVCLYSSDIMFLKTKKISKTDSRDQKRSNVELAYGAELSKAPQYGQAIIS